MGHYDATERGKLLRRLAEVLAEHSESLGRAETTDTGKLLKGNTVASALYLRFFSILCWTCGQGSWDTLPIDKPNMWTMTVRKPLGVVAAVVPWNSNCFYLLSKSAQRWRREIRWC
ncbi:MAG: hypothetical protein Ct9H300mP21_00870 [Pseudomonadota bacterium]|nr:MAG: hypothetical protein Ct9H300mP21_00870 [Pseudomonadota bacterium]